MKYTLSLCCLLLLLSCGNKDLENAKKSLKGTWAVNRIFVDTGGNNQDETGQLGTFSFTETSVNYSFTKQGVTQSGQAPWSLKRDLVNSGFVKVERYTLAFDGMTFTCAFGDQTSDAEKNATKIRLEVEGDSYQLWLTKP